jgi:protein-disulfide isomerase
MASRKEQKEQARARRLAEERAQTEHARRQRRLRILLGVIAGAVIIVAVAIVISTSGGSSTSTTGLQKGTNASKTVSGVSALLTGIPQSGAVLGSPNAPVTMTYYGDLECPACSKFTVSGGFPQLVANEVRAGKVKVVYRSFETATPDPTMFLTQQAAALAAGKQSHFWDFAELFYREQGQEDSGYATESYLDGLASQIPGLSLPKWQSDRSDPALAAQVESDGQAGRAEGVSGTPTLIFQGPKGKPVAASGVPSYSELQKAISDVS